MFVVIGIAWRFGEEFEAHVRRLIKAHDNVKLKFVAALGQQEAP